MNAPLTDDDLHDLTAELRRRHDTLLADAEALEQDAAEAPARPSPERAEQARLVRDRNRSEGFASREEQELGEVRDALQRVDDGTYGVCEGCGDWIDRSRLEMVPETRLCIRCQRDRSAATS